MTEDPWVPFSKRGDAVATAEFLEFIPKLNGRRRELVVDWLMERGHVNGRSYDEYTCYLFERFMDAYAPHFEGHRPLSQKPARWREFFRELNEETLLDFLDYALNDIAVPSRRRSDEPGPTNAATEIERSLRNAHSIYGVGEHNGRYSLIERVDPGVQAAVKKVVEDAGTAGQLLSRAWGKVYELHPDASGAYKDAVTAVETAGARIVTPADTEPTLGKMITQLRSQHESPKSEWMFVLKNLRDEKKPVHQVVGMMELLWRGHMDRHGSEVYADVSLEEARAAVLLAATLVGWLNDGYLVKTE